MSQLSQFVVNEKVYGRLIGNDIVECKITDIKHCSFMGEPAQYFYTVNYFNKGTGTFITLMDVPESVLTKIANKAKVRAIDILKDKTGGQMSVSISALQKILLQLQTVIKKNNELSSENKRNKERIQEMERDMKRYRSRIVEQKMVLGELIEEIDTENL
jgi:hypothetical protein